MKKLLLITIICATTLKSECQKIIIRDKLPDMNLAATYQGFDKGGNTSIAFDSDDSYKWSGESPFKKDGFGYFSADGREVENRQAYISAHFPRNFKQRKSIPPSTNGYPDVDTWRDLWFAIEID